MESEEDKMTLDNNNDNTTTNNTKHGEDLDKTEETKQLLSQAKKLANSKPSEALAYVIKAVTVQTGNLLTAEKYINKEVKTIKQMYEEVEEIRKGIEGIAPTQPAILQSQGKSQILIDAFEDGSSFICKRCGALVKMQRKVQHETVWCDAIE